MVKRNSKRKANSLTSSAKETTKVGIATIVGQGVVGSIGAQVPGSIGSVRTVNTALGLVNVGQLAKTAKRITKF